MKNLAILLILVAFSCSPKNEEVKDEQIDLGPPAEALDSAASPDKDATKINETSQETYLPLPQPVLQLLAQKYPGHKQPILTQGIRAQDDKGEQGPFVISGYFTDDTYLDHALQLQHEKNVIIVAATDIGDNQWRLHELKRDILFNDRGTLRSVYDLNVTEQGQELQNAETGETLKLQKDAIGVKFEDNITTYVYQNNGFTAYITSR
ncbi:hypothetical protein [Pontibacter cellulosilyticus]|uniref:Lipoprotein n=1 Tax=Pontibacter cellulosilyticus TaxID=1720253 RepID=A0A923N469_9BACT|nr:hypothetical protein [Pontibacter cellulosilyticus]MBC5992565.1 hypothetical protein [Pontibacter cellulosilyticus]